ncbi:MAG: hypothetical protein DDT32_00641 [Syntrophomonadaceae bacterium]|nr:hypothetical protein [Bacillota bacterium]
MEEYNLRIETSAATLVGSGEGFGSIVDSDIVYDQMGLPYLPARRIKGLLRESALEVLEMFEQAKLSADVDMQALYHTFGEKGDSYGANIKIRDLYLEGEAELKVWLPWLYSKYPAIMTPHNVLDCFTEIRRQTSIDKDGLAEKGSLRVSRVLNKGHVFTGNLSFSASSAEGEKLMALACANLRRMGSSRNRGLGKIYCSLWKGGISITDNTLTEIRRENP